MLRIYFYTKAIHIQYLIIRMWFIIIFHVTCKLCKKKYIHRVEHQAFRLFMECVMPNYGKSSQKSREKKVIKIRDEILQFHEYNLSNCPAVQEVKKKRRSRKR